MQNNQEKLAKILNTDLGVFLSLKEKFPNLDDVIDKIVKENDDLIKKMVSREEALGKVKKMDKELFDYLEQPNLAEMSDNCGKMCEVVFELSKTTKRGFFLRHEKAKEMLEKFPPKNLMSHFDYESVGELIEKEGLPAVFSSLRFIEDNEWMHKFFDEAYGDLSVDDFEERDVEIMILNPKWLDVAEKFLKKKYHNVSHLKELGVIFVIPLEIDTPGEMLRLTTLLLHYLNEVPFYSGMFKKFSSEDKFSDKIKSLLRGDVLEIDDAKSKIESNEADFLIIQRYLAKDDGNDPRLAMPHINPEVEHWSKAEINLGKLSGVDDELFKDWDKLDFVGDENGSYNLIDLIMSMVSSGEKDYIYHHKEAMWNKIFIELLGHDKIEELIDENLIEGFIKL